MNIIEQSKIINTHLHLHLGTGNKYFINDDQHVSNTTKCKLCIAQVFNQSASILQVNRGGETEMSSRGLEKRCAKCRVNFWVLIIFMMCMIN